MQVARIILAAACVFSSACVGIKASGDHDEVSVVEDAKKLLLTALKDDRLNLPAGYYWEWSGQFERATPIATT